MSADFEVAVTHVLKSEGSFSDIPEDAGGPTNFGITQADLAEFRGHPVSSYDVRNMTVDEAKTIYKNKYWDPLHLDRFNSSKLGLCLFDQVVNFGINGVVQKRLQNVLNSKFGTSLVVDGVLGPLSAAAANAVSENSLCREFLQASEQHYADIVLANHSQLIFLKGWLNRIHALQDKIFV